MLNLQIFKGKILNKAQFSIVKQKLHLLHEKVSLNVTQIIYLLTLYTNTTMSIMKYSNIYKYITMINNQKW